MAARTGLRWLPRLIGPLLLIFFLSRIDLAWFLDRLRQLRPAVLGLALALTLPIVVLRAWRWRLFLPRPRPNPMVTLRIYAVAALLGSITPGQLGELGKVFVPLSDEPGHKARLFWATILDRLLDVTVVALVAALFLILKPPVAGVRTTIPVGLLLGGILLGIGFRPGIRAWLAEKLQPWARRLPSGWRGGFLSLPFSSWVGGWSLSASAWLLNWAAIWVTASAMGLAIPFFHLAGALSGAALLSLLPVTILGMGTRDAALVLLLAPLGIDTPSALALSSVVLFLRVAYAAICALATCVPTQPQEQIRSK